MPNKTIYVRDGKLWAKARQLADNGGLSNVIHKLLVGWVRQREAEMQSEHLAEIELWVGGEAHEKEQEVAESQRLAFTGRLLADSEGFSVAQLPHLRVFRTKTGKLIVYRSWKGTPSENLGATYRVYQDYEALTADPLALDTMWIEGDEELDRNADHTPELRRELATALGREVVVRVD